MNIFRLSPAGIDQVTFWTDEKHPGGAFLGFNKELVVYAVATILRAPKGIHEVGLFQMPHQLYHYLGQELREHSLVDVDIEFVSDLRQVFLLTRQGGVSRLSEDIKHQLDALHVEVQHPEIGDILKREVFAQQMGYGTNFHF